MTGNDILYFKMLIKLGYIKHSFLEIGSAKVQGNTPNLCDLAREQKIDKVYGVDLTPGDGVDLPFDFSIPVDDFQNNWKNGTFCSVALFNVLEHTFDPITVLRNAMYCVEKGGALCVVTPVIWPIHNFPGDYVRLLPNWYEEFARQYTLNLIENTFCWLSEFGVINIKKLMSNGRYELPMFLNLGRSHAPTRYWISRLTHRLFNTYGRSHSYTSSAIGVLFSIPS